MRLKHKTVSVCLMIFICFLWTGSAYLTWLYRLIDIFGNSRVDMLSDVVGYLFQACGLFAYALLVKHCPKAANHKALFPAVLVAEAAAIPLSMLSETAAALLLFGYVMNLLHGVVAGIYLTRLTYLVPQQKRGIVFGVAYGAGSIGSWLLSLPMEQGFLCSNYSLIVYGIMIVLTFVLEYLTDKTDVNNAIQPDFSAPDFKLIALVMLLLSTVKNMGFYFPMADVSTGISLEFSRVFYAIGLIAAGIIGDKNRKYGAICCLASLVSPFISFALKGIVGTGTALWILSYIFFGFFAVWRVVMFCDIAAKRSNLLWLAGFGLIFGRVGDAAGAGMAMLLEEHSIMLISISAILFVITVVVFFVLYQRLYVPSVPNEQKEKDHVKAFQAFYGLSSRECEVMSLLVAGHSNAEIAGELYISENTVKFHVKNLLKKTDCKNRTDLNLKYRQG